MRWTLQSWSSTAPSREVRVGQHTPIHLVCPPPLTPHLTPAHTTSHPRPALTDDPFPPSRRHHPLLNTAHRRFGPLERIPLPVRFVGVHLTLRLALLGRPGRKGKRRAGCLRVGARARAAAGRDARALFDRAAPGAGEREAGQVCCRAPGTHRKPAQGWVA